jgi:Rrf2 family nitric oxide-sensitive transcriptional repressor
MRLTIYTDYTLRVLMYLALNRTRLATIPEIAAAYGISEDHLMKSINLRTQASWSRCEGRAAGFASP